jgi:integrase/recombinase XerD
VFLDDLMKEFSFHIQIKNYSVRTAKGYKNNNLAFMRYLENEFGINELEVIKPSHIKSYLMFLKQKGRKETYINSIFKNIRSFFNFCIEEDYVEEKDNPCLKVKWMKEPKVIISTFEDDEVKRMLNVYSGKDFLSIRNRCILMCFCDLGIRNLELCNITDLDVYDTTIRINGKGRKQRIVPVSAMLKKHLIKYERVREQFLKDKIRAHNNYFLSYTGKPLTVEAVERVVKIAGEKAKIRSNIKCSPHNFRRWYSQQQLQFLDVYSLSRLLGHESLSITKIYLQSMEDQKIVDKAKITSPLMTL